MNTQTNANADATIDISRLTRRFGKRNVVDDVSLHCPAGSLTGLIGLNGAGKSTLLRMAVGLIAPSAGSVTLAGLDIRRQPVETKRILGYVPDRPNVYGWMRVGEAIAFARTFYPTWQYAKCDELVQKFRVPLETKVKHLSKGQAAKLQLLLAVCHEPKVLILDEPTSGFDPIVREEFLSSILEIAINRGQTVLFSSHALADVQRMADRVALMHDGKIVLAGATEKILDRVKRIRVVLEEDAAVPPVSANVLRQQRTGREWLLTVDQPEPPQLEQLRDRPGVNRLDVLDMNLDEVFKDVVRGKEEAVAV